ncbi:MAG: cellulose biosynthesis cyclic di-GMP-binding regulatory protein BcsB, partial [Chthoniobacterales bacterium]
MMQRGKSQNWARRGHWGAALALGIALSLSNATAQPAPAAPMSPMTPVTPMSPMSPMATPATATAVPYAPSVIPVTGLGADRKPAPAGASTIRLPLRQLIGAKEPVYLMTAQSTYTMFVPVSPRYKIQSCKLHLKFTNSIALLSERSVMRVVLDDKTIAQYYLTRNAPDHTVDLEVPVKDLQPGSRQLQFIVAQHYTLECEDPKAPELWTQIFPDESYFEAVVSWNDVYPKLSLLRDLIDQKLWNPYEFHICFPGAAGGLSTDALSWGSIITQGVGLNLSYRPTAVTTGAKLRAGVDNIIVGQVNELTQYLTATEIGAIDGSFIAIKPLPNDPTHFLLVITGTNSEQVGQAAYAFSLITFPLPDSKYAKVGGITLPQKDFWIRHAPVADPGIYSFRQLGMDKNKSIQGWNTGAAPLEIYMPGDLSQDDNSNIELRLHFAYGAAFRDDSVLNLFVNGEFQTAIRLDDQRGAMHYGHKLYLPVKAFQPGRNVVAISPNMVPLRTDHCMMIQHENLWFTLYRDSDFVVPNLDKRARLPSFTLFSETAFPYSSSPDGEELEVVMAGKDETSICAGWMLLAKMAQISGSVLYRATIDYTPSRDKKRDTIIVGPIGTIPDDVFATSPVNPAQLGKLRYLVEVSPSPEATAIGPIAEMLEKLRGTPGERSEREQPSTVEMGLNTDLMDDTMAISYESPYAVARQATVFTARDPATLYNGIYNLQDRQYWDNLDGNLAVWGTTPRTLETARLGPEFIYKITNPIKRAQNNV